MPEGVASPDEQYLEEHLEDPEESGVRSVPRPKARAARDLEERESVLRDGSGQSRPAPETRG